jgi:hypothetical protein
MILQTQKTAAQNSSTQKSATPKSVAAWMTAD